MAHGRRNKKLPLKILLNYLIVEIDRENELKDGQKVYKNSNEENSNNSPDPIRECYLMRNLTVHQDRLNEEVRRYCKFLGISEEHYNPYNKEAENKLRKRYNDILREEARKIIEEKLTTKEELNG